MPNLVPNFKVSLFGSETFQGQNRSKNDTKAIRPMHSLLSREQVQKENLGNVVPSVPTGE